MNALRRQVEEMVEQKGEFVAMPQARAQTMHYMKGLKGASAICGGTAATLSHLEDHRRPSSTPCLTSSARAGLDPDDVTARCRSRKNLSFARRGRKEETMEWSAHCSAVSRLPGQTA